MVLLYKCGQGRGRHGGLHVGRPVGNQWETPSELICPGSDDIPDVSDSCPPQALMSYSKNYSMLPPLAPLKMSERIPGVRRRLRPQPRAASHALTPPAIPSCSLGHAPFHISLVAPTSFAIARPFQLPPQPRSPEHYPATNPARAPQ